MALRFSVKNTAIAVAGTSIAHGLGSTPDEWFYSQRSFNAAVQSTLYTYAAPDATNLYIAAASNAGTADVFCCLNHSIIK